MSKKHEQRTRAQILAKRATPIPTVQVMQKNPLGFLVHFVKKVRAPSKYTPHFGAKEQERAKRCYMQTHFPAKFAAGESGFKNQAALSAPVLCQMSKADHEAYLEARQQEYESVF